MPLDLKALYEKHDKEFLRFERVANPRSKRPDLHAFLLLDELTPDTRDMVSSAEHDEIWLDVKIEALAEVITEEQFVDLIRCGVRYDSDVDSLAMFV